MSDPIDNIEKHLGQKMAIFVMGFMLGAAGTYWYLEKANQARIDSLKETISARDQEVAQFKDQLNSTRKEQTEKISIEIHAIKASAERCDIERQQLVRSNQDWAKSYIDLQVMAQSTQDQCVRSNASLKNDREWLTARERSLRSRIENDERLAETQRPLLGEDQTLCEQYRRGENFLGGASAERCVSAGSRQKSLEAFEKNLEARRKELQLLQQSLLANLAGQK